MTGPGSAAVVARLAHWLVVRAARRWPDDLADDMAAEWQAELAALAAHPLRMLRFAVSLAVSPAVEPDGAAAVPRLEAWARSLAAAVGVTLLAAGLFNAVHVVKHVAGMGMGLVALLGAALFMVAVAGRSRAPVLPRTVTVGAALFAFLLAGNRIAIMPFMGWADILPAVLVWTAGMALTAHLVGRRKHASLVALAGGLVTLEVATVAGALHAAGTLGVSLATAAAWFPLALLPGGTVTFGPAFPGGVHASELLLGNAAAMAGPMLLAAVFVLVLALRRRPARPRSVAPRRGRADLGVPFGVVAAVAALVAAELFRRVPDGAIGVTLHRLIDNSTVFGFGFVEHTPGRIVLALVAGLLAAQAGAVRRA
ncbi:hypothetical protein [Paractinoplanes rishiriensis]|uniref:Uncharacterized protein n=1 Tax=Paractinoplanes rishiriensis TaxID=1050105 RepID=A0A919K7J6_9ACTN|nr:hypothetical protein [Actinoplanes rishiriensis]GIF00818.1 hypothetical protein Ari01nite_82820 [Actinoplanes rishiriensis]